MLGPAGSRIRCLPTRLFSAFVIAVRRKFRSGFTGLILPFFAASGSSSFLANITNAIAGRMLRLKCLMNSTRRIATYVSRHIVFIKGIIDRLVKDFGLVLRGVVVYHMPGVRGTVCSGGLAGFRGRGCRGEGVL